MRTIQIKGEDFLFILKKKKGMSTQFAIIVLSSNASSLNSIAHRICNAWHGHLVFDAEAIIVRNLIN